MTLGRGSLLTLVGALLMLAASAAAARKPWVEGARLEFELTDLRGEPVSSADHKFAGKVLLIDLWATWCPPCISEIPPLIELQDRLGDRGLLIVAIAFEHDEDPESRRERLQRFVQERGINYLVLDGGSTKEVESALPSLRGVTGLPVEILIDRTGRVTETRNGYGFKKSWLRKLNRELEALLNEPASSR
jgi:thiol-disulfide isomerase/thioredoxin